MNYDQNFFSLDFLNKIVSPDRYFPEFFINLYCLINHIVLI